MRRAVVITTEAIAALLSRDDGPLAVRDARADGSDGAWLDFYGIVRDREPDGTPIEAIDYEAHAPMAEHQIHKLLDRLAARFPLSAVLVVHRIGPVPAGEPSLLVRILSPHREEALHACRAFLDELKAEVPIWKHPVPLVAGR